MNPAELDDSDLATANLPFDDDAWGDLLNYIEEKRVVPIIGPELLKVETETGPRPLYEWLAEKLAGRLGVNVSGPPLPLTLNDVVCSYLGARGRREEAYTRLRSIMRESNFAPPPALRQLAQITDFDSPVRAQLTLRRSHYIKCRLVLVLLGQYLDERIEPSSIGVGPRPGPGDGAHRHP